MAEVAMGELAEVEVAQHTLFQALDRAWAMGEAAAKH
jgi:hypothetical protein